MAEQIAKLDAVNEILAAIKIYPVAALQTGTASDAAQAERTLDRVDFDVQLQGLPENTYENYKITGAGAVLAAPAGTIRIEGYGPEKNRFSLQDSTANTLIWDNLAIASDGKLPAGDYNVKLIIKRAFVDLSIESKRLITARAAQIHQRRTVGSQAQDSALTNELLEAQQNTDGPGFIPGDKPRNFFAGPAQPQQQEQR